MFQLAVVVLLSQSPPPWDEPLAPAFRDETPVAAAPDVVRPTWAQTIGRGAYLTYRATVSSAKGANCAFAPSCSLYGHQAIERVGLGLGLVLFGARLMRGHLNLDRFYRFDGAHLVDELDTTLKWLWPQLVRP